MFNEYFVGLLIAFFATVFAAVILTVAAVTPGYYVMARQLQRERARHGETRAKLRILETYIVDRWLGTPLPAANAAPVREEPGCGVSAAEPAPDPAARQPSYRMDEADFGSKMFLLRFDRRRGAA